MRNLESSAPHSLLRTAAGPSAEGVVKGSPLRNLHTLQLTISLVATMPCCTSAGNDSRTCAVHYRTKSSAQRPDSGHCALVPSCCTPRAADGQSTNASTPPGLFTWHEPVLGDSSAPPIAHLRPRQAWIQEVFTQDACQVLPNLLCSPPAMPYHAHLPHP